MYSQATNTRSEASHIRYPAIKSTAESIPRLRGGTLRLAAESDLLRQVPVNKTLGHQCDKGVVETAMHFLHDEKNVIDRRNY